MSMISCKECAAPVSSEAATCPQCGVAVKKKTSAWFWIISIPVGLVVGLMIIGALVDQPARYAVSPAYDRCMQEFVRSNVGSMADCERYR